MTILLLTPEGIYISRDRLGRTPGDHRTQGRCVLCFL